MRLVLTGLLVMALAGTAYAQAAKKVVKGQSEIKATQDGSTLKGDATLEQVGTDLQVAVNLTGVPPGKHGLHIHEFGACGDQGKAAGAHYNPNHAGHGLVMKDGPGGAHAGDLGNIEVGEDGTGTLQVTVPNVSLTGAAPSVAGRAIIVHEKEDDFSQPTGNAGGRIGCGPIVISDEH